MKFIAEYLTELLRVEVFDVELKVKQNSVSFGDENYAHGLIKIIVEFYVKNACNLFTEDYKFGSIILVESLHLGDKRKLTAICLKGKETDELIQHILGKE